MCFFCFFFLRSSVISYMLLQILLNQRHWPALAEQIFVQKFDWHRIRIPIRRRQRGGCGIRPGRCEMFAVKLGGSRRSSICFCMDSGDVRHKINDLIIIKDRHVEHFFRSFEFSNLQMLKKIKKRATVASSFFHSFSCLCSEPRAEWNLRRLDLNFSHKKKRRKKS